MEKQGFSHLAVELLVCPGLPCCPPEASLGKGGDGPFTFCSPLGRVEEEPQCCPECCNEEIQLDFRPPLTSVMREVPGLQTASVSDE